ncbi:hypothetical protein BGZ49_004864 [Haplosporangium sp. Z 27]|nr:hypothetical protein BGZ49_004864 [Haplosporangium sp. Z 27]
MFTPIRPCGLEMSTLAVEVLEQILRYMTPSTLSRVMLLNRHWSQVARMSRQRYQIWAWNQYQSTEYQQFLRNLIIQQRIRRLQLDNRIDLSIPTKDNNCEWVLELLKSNQPEKGFLTELILYHQDIPPSSFYPVFVAHATTLQSLQIYVSAPCEFNIMFTLNTLPNLRSLVLSHVNWNATNPPKGICLTGYTKQEFGCNYPNLQSLELRSVQGGVALHILLKKIPNLKSLKVMQYEKDSHSSWMGSIRPKLKEIGASMTGARFRHDYMSWLLQSRRGVESLEWPTAQFVPATFIRLSQICTSLKELVLTEVEFTEYSSSALFNMLCEPNVMQRIVAPLATFNVQYALERERDGYFWRANRLESLFVRFDCSLVKDDKESITTNSGCCASASSTSRSHSCESSGALFRYLAKYCPRLTRLCAFIEPQVCLGQKGLRQLAGLQELGGLEIFVNSLDPMMECDIQWLQHESVHALDERYDSASDGYYWPSLETIKVKAGHPTTSLEYDQWNQWVNNLSLRFAFTIEYGGNPNP